MPTTTIVHLTQPLKAVRILTDYHGQGDAEISGKVDRSVPSEDIASKVTLEDQKRLYHDACLAVQEVSARLNQLYDEVFAGHHEAIARLSVEIARKVLMQNISEGDYEIELIIKEALKSAPETSGTVVHLNPQDLADFQKLQEAGQVTLSDVKLEADETIGRAECVVESPKGIIKLLIDEHLEQISKALVKTG